MFVAAAYVVVKYVPPAKVTVSPLAIVSGKFTPSDISQSYTPVIVAQVLSPLKYLVASGVPVALKSAVTVTAPPVAEVGVKSIYEPFVVVIVVYEGTSQVLSLLKNLVVVSVAPTTVLM